MFLLTDVDDFTSINIKTDPENIQQMIDEHQAIRPGYHMNKKYWITVIIDGSLPDKLILSWIDRSYFLVYSALPSKIKSAIEKNH